MALFTLSRKRKPVATILADLTKKIDELKNAATLAAAEQEAVAKQAEAENEAHNVNVQTEAERHAKEVSRLRETDNNLTSEISQATTVIGNLQSILGLEPVGQTPSEEPAE